MPRRRNIELLRRVGMRIRQVRLGLGMTQATLAEKTALQEVTISRIENGKGCSLSTLEALSTALGVPLGALADDTQPIPLTPDEQGLLGVYRALPTNYRQVGVALLETLVEKLPKS